MTHMTNEQTRRLAELITGRPQQRRRAALSPARDRILAAFRQLEHDLGMVPTVREVCAKSGRSPGTVQYHLARLRRQGVLAPAPGWTVKAGAPERKVAA